MTPTEFRDWRLSHGWSQMACAHVLQTGHTNIANWEAGRTPIGGRILHMVHSVNLIGALPTFDLMYSYSTYADLASRIRKANNWPRRGRPGKPE